MGQEVLVRGGDAQGGGRRAAAAPQQQRMRQLAFQGSRAASRARLLQSERGVLRWAYPGGVGGGGGSKGAGLGGAEA